MQKPILHFVKPHPPREILRRRCPIPESYRYDWEPLTLKYFAHTLKERLSDVDVRVWHLMDERDDREYLRAVRADSPRAVFFTETDIHVNMVSALARAIKALCPRTLTVVGGKQTSLLQPGDMFPFQGIDLAAAGDGIGPILETAERALGGTPLRDGLFISWDEGTGRVGAVPRNARDGALAALDPGYREMPVVNHGFQEYGRSAPILIGTGCPHHCSFCQSPMDFGKDDPALFLREPSRAAEEIEALRLRGVTSVFSLESNMNLGHLERIYAELARRGVERFPVSGFVRTSDLLAAHQDGSLERLARCGLGPVHTGIDVPVNGAGDVFDKGDSMDDVRRALDACMDAGVIVQGTYIGRPEVLPGELEAELSILGSLPLAGVDVRLAIALRHTEYYKRMEPHLLRHPDRDPGYFDRQNYRYQTIRIPGRIAPEDTYRIVRRFLRELPRMPARRAYVSEMTRRHPDTREFFKEMG